MTSTHLIQVDSPATSGLVGIAALAERAPKIDHRNEVAYAGLACRSVLARCDSPRMPFQWTINPYRGCEFGCVYCYARYTHEFMELHDWQDFERKVFVKQGAAETLRRDLRRYKPGEWITIGAATDPYQPAERRFKVTQSILEEIARHEGLRLSITTKSNLILRDLDLLRRITARNEVHVNVTVTTPRPALARILEPRAPRPDLRLEAVARLNEGGVRAGVFVMPVLPRINDAPADVASLARRAADANATHLCAQVLFLRSSSWKRFRPFLDAEFPHLVRYYAGLFGRNQEGLRTYWQEMRKSFASLREQYGLQGDPEAGRGRARPLPQQELDFG